MREMPFTELADLAELPENGWSIGSFGAIGEFVREADEPVRILRSRSRIELLTAKGAMRLERSALVGIAWDSLSSDGRGWTHNLALCAPEIGTERHGIAKLGFDHAAIRPSDRRTPLFDLGVARGLIRMCVRTDVVALQAALEQAEGSDFLSSPALIAAVMSAQPNRVMLSPAGRIEVFQPIPGVHDLSPIGPHTHLLPRLIAARRLHNANDPIPDGWQAVLNIHPPRPWIGARGERRLDHERDTGFRRLLRRYGDDREAELEQRLTADVIAEGDPTAFFWPAGRRDRAKGRLVLRRLSAAGDPRADRWRSLYDRAGVRQSG